MRRNYSEGEFDNIEFFTGVEVEHTPVKGMLTLFVTGYHTSNVILDKANNLKVRHIYLGANHSFAPENDSEWMNWGMLINDLLKHDYWVSLDLDSFYCGEFTNMCIYDDKKFIPIISVKIPHMSLYNYNTVLKLDDTDFKDTNPGVWSHQLNDLLDRKCFTNWDAYNNDIIVEESNGKSRN